MAKKKTVNTHAALAKHFGVSLTTIGVWVGRGMPGKRGEYSITEIEKWRSATFRRRPEDNRQAPTKDNARLVKALADKEEANALIADVKAKLKSGDYAHIDDVNLFIAEFLTETRRHLMRIAIDVPPGYPSKFRSRLRDDITSRLATVLENMHEWLSRAES